jgi:hypothetical protein
MDCSGRLRAAREKMVKATELANLTIHTLDPVGLETIGNSPMGGSAVAIRERQDDLKVLADLTGGRSVISSATPEQALPSLFAESNAYYLLAFAPAETSASGKFHSIEVKVNRPGVAVRTRSGYYAGETTQVTGKSGLIAPDDAAPLQGVLPRRDVPLGVSVAPFAIPGRQEAAVAAVLNVTQTANAGQPRRSTAADARSRSPRRRQR